MGRGQIWSLDLGASVTVFMLAFLLLAFMWGYVRKQAEDQQSMVDLRESALTAADLLVRTPGFPSNWTNGSVQSVGLATEENLLSEGKVLGFVGMDYNRSLEVLELGAYNYKFQLLYPNGSLVYVNGTPAEIGANFTGTQSSISHRYALLDSAVKQRVVLSMLVWK